MSPHRVLAAGQALSHNTVPHRIHQGDRARLPGTDCTCSRRATGPRSSLLLTFTPTPFGHHHRSRQVLPSHPHSLTPHWLTRQGEETMDKWREALWETLPMSDLPRADEVWGTNTQVHWAPVMCTKAFKVRTSLSRGDFLLQIYTHHIVHIHQFLCKLLLLRIVS